MTAREWDVRIVWNVRHQRWWWNAWRESTETELWGFTDSETEALREMTEAINASTASTSTQRLPGAGPMAF